ncbi:MAG: hypothetical protein IT385_10320 [Deltaproteobacteria bacterium]|nr:hypothetical protein [Deltaproteobacteria bacterium]
MQEPSMAGARHGWRVVTLVWLLAAACGDDGASQAQDTAPLDTTPETEVLVSTDTEVLEGDADDAAEAAVDADDAVEAIDGVDVVDPQGPVAIPYDRQDLSMLAPFPDDVLLVADATLPTGRRVSVPEPDRPDDVKSLLGVLATVPETLDGWSPLAPLVVPMPGPIDTTSVPTSEAASVDPLASVALYDIAADSPTYLQRRAFHLILKDEKNRDGSDAHTWVIFPSAPLEPRGRYALVITRGALLADGRALGPSDYMTGQLASAGSPAADALTRLAAATPAVRAEDVALLLSVSVRSTDSIGDDLLAMRAALRLTGPPEFTIDSVDDDGDTSAVGAIIHGTWTAPSFRDGDFVARDAEGAPRMNGATPLPFVLALPRGALEVPAPIIIYQHGNPGSAEREVPWAARNELAAAGFAVLGFTNIQNRELNEDGDISPATLAIFVSVLQNRRFPDYVAKLDTAEQLSLITLVPALASLDLLPLGAPDGVPDLDVSAPLGYLGISAGSQQGVGLLAFAPEIRAAALVVGGGRWSATVVHQESQGPAPTRLYQVVTSVYPNITRHELWVGIALSQMGMDAQDWLMHARHLYREPYDLESSARASVLAFEGINDSMVPPSSTRGAAAAFGLPLLEPSAEPVPSLATITAPVAANIDAATTGAMLQMVPSGLSGLQASGGCEDEPEGHFCPQIAPDARALRASFFRSALEGVPRIVTDEER